MVGVLLIERKKERKRLNKRKRKESLRVYNERGALSYVVPQYLLLSALFPLFTSSLHHCCCPHVVVHCPPSFVVPCFSCSLSCHCWPLPVHCQLSSQLAGLTWHCLSLAPPLPPMSSGSQAGWWCFVTWHWGPVATLQAEAHSGNVGWVVAHRGDRGMGLWLLLSK